MTQIIRLGKDLTACRCGQEEKIVILIGRTQHGKSSLVRSILDYGGYKKEGDKVKHVLKDEDGKDCVVHFEKDDIEDLYDFIPSTQDTSDHVHLKIIDTPGLDDSDNAKEAEKSARIGACAQQVRVIDERHEFSILRTMANLGRIHTVCFVLDIGSNLGATIQSQFREYLDIFKLSKLAKSFHFAHTKVDVDRRFQDKTRDRPTAVNETFDIAKSSAHHFIDNLPDNGDEISIHFSNWGLSGLLRSMSKQSSQLVLHLNYPKSDAQKLMDGILRTTFKAQESEWTTEISTLEAKMRQWASTKRGIDSRASCELTSWRNIHSQAVELDSTTLVQVGFEEKHERAHFFNRSRLSFGAFASSPIRHFEIEKSNEDGGCQWSPIPTHDNTIGRVSCHAGLISWSSGTAIWGKIRLMGWAKEAKADELKVLREEENKAFKDYTATLERAQVFQRDIDQADDKIKNLRQKVKTFQTRYECLSLDHIPMRILKKRSQYFATSGIISYAFGLDLNINLCKRSTLKISEIKGRQREIFEAKLKAATLMRKIYTRSVESFKGDEKMRNEYAAKVTDLDASIAAASYVLKVLPQESLFIGVIAALRESIQKKRLCPWEDAYQQVMEVYHCDTKKWEEYAN